MNNKGFTLIELIATIVLLSLVMSIGAYAVINIINASRDSNYNLLINNIKDAAEVYYQECKYSKSEATANGVTCNNNWRITLGNLVNYGYLAGNGTDTNDKFILVNPKKDNKSISECTIQIAYSNGEIVVTAVTGATASRPCPTTADYSG